MLSVRLVVLVVFLIGRISGQEMGSGQSFVARHPAPRRSSSLPLHADWRTLALAGLGAGLAVAAAVTSDSFDFGIDGSFFAGTEGVLDKAFTLANSWGRTVGLDECAEMAICEAHSNFRSYGIVALPIILLFPGWLNSKGDPTSDWQAAAVVGKYHRSDNCYSRYKCVLNPLWIAKFLMTTLVT